MELCNRIAAYYPDLYRYAIKLTEDLDEADDLVQETMLKALRFIHTFEDGTNLLAWLFTIMRNHFINGKTRDKKVRETFQTYSIDEALYDSHKDNSKKTDELASCRDIIQLYNSLGEGITACLTDYIAGYKYDEIAERQGLPCGTVKENIFITRMYLADLFRARGYDIKYGTNSKAVRNQKVYRLINGSIKRLQNHEKADKIAKKAKKGIEKSRITK